NGEQGRKESEKERLCSESCLELDRPGRQVKCIDRRRNADYGQHCDPGEEESSKYAESRSHQALHDRFGDEHKAHISPLDTERTNNGDISPTLIYADRKGIEDDKNANSKSQDARDGKAGPHCGYRVFERLASNIRPRYLVPDTELFLEAGRQLVYFDTGSIG